MTNEEYERLLQMTDAECADVLENTALRWSWMMGRKNGKNALHIAYEVALLRAINKLKEPEVVYLCKYHKEPNPCKHTHRLADALNFEEIAEGKWIEREERS